MQFSASTATNSQAFHPDTHSRLGSPEAFTLLSLLAEPPSTPQRKEKKNLQDPRGCIPQQPPLRSRPPGWAAHGGSWGTAPHSYPLGFYLGMESVDNPLLTTFSTRLGRTTLARGILTGSLLGCTVLRGILIGRLVIVSPLLTEVLSLKTWKIKRESKIVT